MSSQLRADLDDPDPGDVRAHASLRSLPGEPGDLREAAPSRAPAVMLRSALHRLLRREYVLAVLLTAGIAVLVSRTFS